MALSKREYDRSRYLRHKAERTAERAPDAITTLTPDESAYIAGFVDGSASIFVAAVGPARRKTVYPIVCFVNAHRPTIEWLAERLKAGTVKRHNVRATTAQHRTQLFGKRAQLLCAALLPFLKVKIAHAQLVLTFPCDARVAPGVKIERTAINATRYRLRDEINGLNGHQDRRVRELPR